MESTILLTIGRHEELERGASEEDGRSEKPAMRPFRAAVESAGHSIYWTDATGTIEYVNPAFEDQTGFTAEEAIGTNANILQSGVHDELFYERLWDRILSGEGWEGEIVNERKNGERYVVKQTTSPITDETGDIVRFVAANEDITAIREYQDQIERERDRFAELLDAVLSHSSALNSPNQWSNRPTRPFGTSSGFPGVN